MRGGRLQPRLMAKPFLPVLVLLAVAGCGSSSGGAQISTGLPPAGGGGTLAYALPALPSTLDPLAARSRAEQTVTRQLYEPLIEHLTGPYAQAAPQAGLALEARPSRDRTTWTVTLRSGVRFQDGTPFNAAAVLANSRRWQTSVAGQRLIPHLFAVDAPRPDEVRFLLDKPVPDLVRRLSSPRLAIVSPRALDPASGQNADFLPDSAGSGTGAFEAGPSGPGRQMLSRFAGWWGSPMGLGPSLDGVTFVVAPQPNQRLRLLQEGAVQVADPLDPPGLRAAASDPLLDKVGGPLSGIGLEGSVRGIDSASATPVLSAVWLTRLTG
jgi:peptide/nickel transport system substrate-binding protein